MNTLERNFKLMNSRKLIEHTRNALFQYEAHRLGMVDDNLDIVSERDRDLSHPIIVEEEEILEKYISKHKVRLLSHRLKGKTTCFSLKKHTLDALETPNSLIFVQCFDPQHMSCLMRFLFDPTILNETLKPIWCTILDDQFVKERIIEPLIHHHSMAQQLSHDLRKIATHGETFEIPKKITEPRPFLLTDPKPRTFPLPTEKIPRTIKPLEIPKSHFAQPAEKYKLEKTKLENKDKSLKLFNLAQKNQFHVAKPAPAKIEQIRERLAQESNEKYEKNRVRNSKNVKLNQNIPVKLTTAAILREEVLLRKKQKQQEIALAEAEMGLRDVAEFEQWKQELKQKEEEELQMHQEKKRLEVQLLHEEAVLAKLEKLKEKRDIAASVLQEKEEIKALGEEIKKEQEEEKRKKIEEVKHIKEAVIKAKQLNSKEKIKQAANLAKEKKLMQEEAQRRANEERARKSQLIQQIRLLEKKGNAHSKEVDLSETSGYGLLGEMSIIELQERVVQTKVKERASAEQKRKEIAETKANKVKELSEKLMVLNLERQSRKDSRIQRNLPDRASTVLSMQSERTEIKGSLMDNNAVRISQQLKSSKSRSGASSRLVSAGLSEGADEIDCAERHYLQKKDGQIPAK
ncbi:hypothetical protein HDV01_007516 [Terramyces sp. JEL0728]|nr:hypothetical protein HDV01_007516 [Terramyces sp. JEL0728]